MRAIRLSSGISLFFHSGRTARVAGMEHFRQRKGRRIPPTKNIEIAETIPTPKGLASQADVTLRTRSGRQIQETAITDAITNIHLSAEEPAEAHFLPSSSLLPAEEGKLKAASDSLLNVARTEALTETNAASALPQRRRSTRVANRVVAAGKVAALVLEAATSGGAPDPPDAEIPMEKPKRKRKAKADSAEGSNTAKTKPTAKPKPKNTALIGGSPSHELALWTEASMAAAIEHLRKVDPKLVPLIEQHCGRDNRVLFGKGTSNMFASLARNICSQQLATKAAYSIHLKFITTCKRSLTDPVQPADILKLQYEELRACGLSGAKANYIIDLATHFHNGLLSDEAIAVMDDETLITELTKVKGIGRWSVDMFAMFHLGRMDVLPVGDLGVRNGMKALYGLKEPPKPAEMEEITDSWRPFRSLGSYCMWHVEGDRRSPAKKKKAATNSEPDVAAGSKVPF